VDKYGCLPLWDWDCHELSMEQLDEAYLLLEIKATLLALKIMLDVVSVTPFYIQIIFASPPKYFLKQLLLRSWKNVPKDVFSGIVCN
jgi:hypothetical protein